MNEANKKELDNILKELETTTGDLIEIKESIESLSFRLVSLVHSISEDSKEKIDE